MTSKNTLAGTEDIDEATIDGALHNVGSGRGMLASMISGFRHQAPLPEPADTAAMILASSVESPLLLLRAYWQRHREALEGRGLLLKSGQPLIPRAFDGLMTSPRPEADFDPSDKAIQSDFVKTKQAEHLLNAALIRAALTMSRFTNGTPEFRYLPGEESHQFVFTEDGKHERVLVNKASSPLSLHREVRTAVQKIWRTRLADVAGQVVLEFERAMKDAGIAPQHTETARLIALHSITASEPFERLRRSSAVFLDITRVAESCDSIVQALDREAIRNALRHGARGLNWNGYEIHCSPAIKEEIALAQDRGGLAYSAYSPGLIELLCVGSEDSYGYEFAAPVAASGSTRAAAQFTARFMRALDSTVSEPVRLAFQGVSPRYLCVLALGQAGEDSLATACQKHLDGEAYLEMATAAGRRLGDALNLVAHKTQSTNILPWMRVLSSRSAYDLLLGDIAKDDSTRGLSSLILYANAKRSKGDRLDDLVFAFPSAEQLVSSPTDDEVLSLAGLLDGQAMSREPRAQKTARWLLQEFFSGLTPDSDASSTWSIELGGFRPNGDVKLGVRHKGVRQQLWSLLTITVSGSSHLSSERSEIATQGAIEVSLSSNAPHASASLSVKSEPNFRFKPLVTAPSKKATTLELGLQDISGLNPGIKPQMRDGPSPAALEVLDRLNGELPAELKEFAGLVKAAIIKRPTHAACLFPAIAAYQLAGGVFEGAERQRALGANLTLRLARAAVGANNPLGLELLCSKTSSPGAMTASGLSLLDVALDAAQPAHITSTLNGLRSNGKLAKSELASLVQRSAGRLVERHPDAIPLAIELGLVADETLLRSWTALHPHRKCVELNAQVDALRLDRLIASQVDVGVNQPGLHIESQIVEPPRRRARVI